METWTRDDGRFYSFWMERDLFDLVVVIRHGGMKTKAVHARTIPVCGLEEGARMLCALAERRARRGYVRVAVAECRKAL